MDESLGVGMSCGNMIDTTAALGGISQHKHESGWQTLLKQEAEWVGMLEKELARCWKYLEQVIGKLQGYVVQLILLDELGLVVELLAQFDQLQSVLLEKSSCRRYMYQTQHPWIEFPFRRGRGRELEWGVVQVNLRTRLAFSVD